MAVFSSTKHTVIKWVFLGESLREGKLCSFYAFHSCHLSPGTITSSSPTAQPAEVLLQATPPHRRARSAAWSYIFLPEEAWCDLTIHLPAAVLLKELHIQPHLASLASECSSVVLCSSSAPSVVFQM